MGIKKLKEKVLESETESSSASEYCPTEDTDTSDSPTMERMKKCKVQLESTKEGPSRKPKSLKSKSKQVCTDSSKKSGSGARKKRTRYTDMYDDVEAKFSATERADRVLARLGNFIYDNVGAKFSVTERADKLLARLGDEVPFFQKCMCPSNVTHGFWLHIPKQFRKLHLPNHDASVILVDEWGNEYETSYLLKRYGLSAGWRGFAIEHRLLKGDILIFHLTEPCKLRVHIVRVNTSDVISAALCLMNLNAAAREAEKKDKRKRKRKTYVEPFPIDISTPPENVKGKNVQDHLQ